MIEKRRILITGANGFIGSFIVDEALRRGYDVWAGVRSSSSRERLRDDRIRFIDLQYDDKAALTEQLRKIVSESGAWAHVVHNAGITKTLNKKDFYKVNVLYTQNLVEALRDADCKPEKFLLMSSLSSFGPIKEKTSEIIYDFDRQCPDSDYGKSKLEAELFVKKQEHFPYIIFRPTGVYGPGDKDYLMEIKSIKAGLDVKVGMKPQKITFIYVKDLAAAVFLALDNSAVLNKSYFVADGDVYTDNDFAGIVKRLLGKRFVINMRVPMWMCYIACVCSEYTGKIIGKSMTLNTDKYKILKQRNWVCDTKAIKSELGFVPKYELNIGLEETINFNKACGLL